MAQRSATFASMVSIIGTLLAACMDTSASAPSLPVVGSVPASALAPVYGAEDLHRVNPMDGLGRLHGALSREIVALRHRERVSFPVACALTANRMVRDQLYSDLLPGLTDAGRQRIRSHLLETVLCSSGAIRHDGPNRWRFAAFTEVDSIPAELSPAADSILDSIYVETDRATSANDLANRLSPYFSAAAAMDSIDKWQLQATIAIAQDSYETWSPADISAEVAFLEECDNGNAEQSTYTVDEIMYVCQDSEWRMAANTNPLRVSPFRLVTRGAFVQNCSLSPGQRVDKIVLSDVWGAMVGIRASRWAFWTTLNPVFAGEAFAASVVVASLASMAYQSWESYQC